MKLCVNFLVGTTDLRAERSAMQYIIFALVHIGFVIRVLLRRHRDPASRAAWVAIILALPVVGIFIYLLFGEINIGRKRVLRMKRVVESLPDISNITGYENKSIRPKVPERHKALFNVGQSISGFSAIGGNHARLMEDSNTAIDTMVADIDRATKHVHLMFYIWMPDNNGRKMADALMRAAKRGVVCRAMVDDLGSRLLLKSDMWREMEAAGVKLGIALKIGNPLVRVFDGRIDIRNHRKILIIDNKITYCGSQNCADPEFLTKAKYAPWVDAVMRFTGPVVRQNQYIFASDWMGNFDEDIRDLLTESMAPTEPGFPAQVVATGPTSRTSAASEMFESLIYSAKRELNITTPYYVPNASMQSALCAAANRGVDTRIIFPARNDDFAVAATCRSYFEELLHSGVKIFEFHGGLLHTKSLTLDNEITFIGSANMDRRSFDLNYENNILLYDIEITKIMKERQDMYFADSTQVTAAEVAEWSWRTRLYQNSLSIVGPLL